MDTIREIIIQDFLARAAVIRTSSPAVYNTDIGASVHRARKELYADMSPPEIPGCNIWPGIETAEASYGGQTCSMPITIEGIDFYGDENPSVVSEKILGDLKRAFLSQWQGDLSPNYIDGISYRGGGTDAYPDEESKTVGAKVILQVEYTETIGDPYSQ